MAEHAYVLGREAPGDDFVQLSAVQTAVMQDAEQLGEAGAEVALRLREREGEGLTVLVLASFTLRRRSSFNALLSRFNRERMSTSRNL